VNTIEFIAQFGEKKVKVILSQVFRGAEGWSMNIGGYYDGMSFYRDGSWQAHLNDKSDLTSDDITAMGELIDEKTKNS